MKSLKFILFQVDENVIKNKFNYKETEDVTSSDPNPLKALSDIL